MTWLRRLDRLAHARAAAGLRRELRPRPADDTLIDLSGNDYLGLARSPEVAAAATQALDAYGLGATASRLVRGHTDLHAELETQLAALLGCEAALVFSSGYLANLGAVRALATPGVGSPDVDQPVLLASDAHNHASIVDACRLAGAGRGGARTMVYAHADADAARAAVAAAPGAAVVITESVFSVFGDLAPLSTLSQLAHEHSGVLLIDDAHAVGVLGARGGGGAVAAGIAGDPHVVITATLSKALGAAGGVVAGPAEFIGHLVETSRPFIYDTGLPPAVAAGALAAVGAVRGDVGDAARGELLARAHMAHEVLSDAGLRVSDPAGAVLCVAAPGPAEALAWAAACRDLGVAVGCFRPPSTPDGASYLRLTISTGVPWVRFEDALGVIIGTTPDGASRLGASRGGVAASAVG